jgi:hypothetical protein
MYQDLLLKDLVSASTVVREYVRMKNHQETEIRFCFWGTPKQNSVSVSETLRNGNPFPFPRHSETEFCFRFRITLLYKPQHTPVVQWYSSLCQQLDSALAAGHRDTTLAIHLTLLSNCLVGLLDNTDQIVLGFHTAYSAHDVISLISEVTSLQRFRHKVSNHLLGGIPPNADLLHVHQICNEKVSDVNMPRALATWSLTILL